MTIRNLIEKYFQIEDYVNRKHSFRLPEFY